LYHPGFCRHNPSRWHPPSLGPRRAGQLAEPKFKPQERASRATQKSVKVRIAALLKEDARARAHST
jgi:hypothetical protein